jgi:uncharacterized protein YndB with AHSA1/START domain
VPTTRRSRSVSAAPETVWELVADPYAFPRWWPRVQRMEGVAPERWTKVLSTAKGKVVRVDEHLVESEPLRRRAWGQDLEGSPFERLLRELTTEVSLDRERDATVVTLVMDQRLRGLNRLGGPLVRRAARRVLDEALDGVERACAGESRSETPDEP